jgi:magnesium transporter
MTPHTAAEILNDPVTAHIRQDSPTLRPDWTVADALDHMRKNPPGGRVIYFYVTDADDHLAGVVPTRRLLLSQPETKVEEVMIRRVIAVPADATVLDACEFFTLHRLLAFPVIDDDRRLVGVIDVELYTDELATDGGSMGEAPSRIGGDVFELIGVHLTEAQQANPAKAARGRFPWLLCNIAAGLAAAGLASLYDDVLTWRNAVLALFIPIVLALSESVAIQSVTLVVERRRSGSASADWLIRRGVIESLTGLFLGAGAAVVVAVVAAVWLRDLRVVGILFGAIGLGVAISALIGFLVPTLLHRLRWNPQVAAGPVSLASADMLTLLIYFNLARLAA